MENQATILQQAVSPQGKELSKYQLHSANAALNAPYIEHWVIQLHGVSPEKLDDPERLVSLLNQAVDTLGLTRVSDHSHYFGPGVSSVIILSESHLSAHTWPELGYAHLDAVTCVKALTKEGLERVFMDIFGPSHIHLAQLEY